MSHAHNIFGIVVLCRLQLSRNSGNLGKRFKTQRLQQKMVVALGGQWGGWYWHGSGLKSVVYHVHSIWFHTYVWQIYTHRYFHMNIYIYTDYSFIYRFIVIICSHSWGSGGLWPWQKACKDLQTKFGISALVFGFTTLKGLELNMAPSTFEIIGVEHWWFLKNLYLVLMWIDNIYQKN